MKFKLLLSSLLFLASFSSYAQTFPVSGKIVDAKDNSGLPGSTVLLIHLPDSARAGAVITDGEGKFNFSVKNGQYVVKASFTGFQTLTRRMVVAGKPLAMGNLGMQLDAKTLKEVQITEKVPTAVQKGDTTEFNAKAMKVNPDANSDELVEKVPGVVIQDGKVTARGQDVKKVRVDGKEFFGDDAMATLKNLPADVVDKIQLLEEQSEQSRLSGVDDGNRTMTMNIVTRTDRRQGTFGRVTAGAGTNDRYQAGGTVNFFTPKRRVTLLGGTNNINQQAFGMEDFLGGGMGGGRQGGGGGFGGGGGGFMSNGLTTTHNVGVNYSQEWGKKITLSGSYFGNSTDNQGSGSYFRNYFAPERFRFDTEEGEEEYRRKNVNHRINARFEYKIDSSNTLFIQPRLSFQMNNGFSNQESEAFYKGETAKVGPDRTRNDLQGYNLGTDAIFRHQFNKKGRSASIGVNVGASKNDGDTFNFLDVTTYDYQTRTPSYTNTDRLQNRESDGLNLGVNLTYTEPVSKTSQLSLNYNYGLNQNKSNNYTYDYSEEFRNYSLINESVSSVFNNNSFSHQVGLGYNYFNEKINFSTRGAVQYSELSNERLLPRPNQMDKGFVRFVPNANFQYRFTRSKNLRVFYNGFTQNPSLDQLQDVLDKNNPLALRIGNPDLDQSYRHNLNFRYTATNTEKSTTFVANVSGALTQNQIVNNQFINNLPNIKDQATGEFVPQNIYFIGDFFNGDTLRSRGTLSRAENLNGNYNLRSFMSYSLPLKLIKSNVNFDLSADMNRTPGITTPIEQPGVIISQRNYTYSQNYGGGLTLSSNISPKLDFNVSTRGTYTNNYNTLTPDRKTNYFNQINRARLNYIFSKGFVFTTDVTHRFNTSVTEGNPNFTFTMWNLSIGKKLFKKQNGDIRLSVFDALGQNKGFRQSVTNNYQEEARSLVLQRYYMITFTYNIRKFGQGQQAVPAGPENREGWQQRRERMDGGGGGGGFGPGRGNRDF